MVIITKAANKPKIICMNFTAAPPFCHHSDIVSPMFSNVFFVAESVSK